MAAEGWPSSSTPIAQLVFVEESIDKVIRAKTVPMKPASASVVSRDRGRKDHSHDDYANDERHCGHEGRGSQDSQAGRGGCDQMGRTSAA